MKQRKFKCVLIGESSLIIPCGNLVLDNEGEIAAVISPNKEVIKWCKEYDIAWTEQVTYEWLAQFGFDYLFSIVHYGILKDDILSLPKKLAINYHDALLPAYAGIHATSWAIMQGERRHGITWHVMENQVDAGDILVQKRVAIQLDETVKSLNLKCFQAAIEGFKEVMAEIVSNCIILKKQDLHKRSYYGKWDKYDHAGLINWNQKESQIIRFVNSLRFDNYDNTLITSKVIIGQRFYIVEKVEKYESSCQQEAGMARFIPGGLVIGTSTRPLLIAELRNLSGDVVDWEEFLQLPEQFSVVPKEEIAQEAQKVVGLLSRHEEYWVKKLNCAFQLGTQKLLDIMETGSKENEQKALHKLEKTSDVSILEKLLLAIWQEVSNYSSIEEYFIGLGKKQTDSLKLSASIVPFRLRRADHVDAGMALHDLRQELKTVQEKDTFLKDVLYRYPALRDSTFVPEIIVHDENLDSNWEENDRTVLFVADSQKGKVQAFTKNASFRMFADEIIRKVIEW